ncbi:MAG TPA: PEGA domain-containing protein, partial [Burkholderiales bacterium]|nr:PEGA domain-containing protein [Burkholderiales bacterium]
LGVNLGPVRLVKDLNSQMNIIGDGINVAQRVMSFARPGQLLVSRSFYEVVSCLSRDYVALFRHEGSRTDKHVRAHEVYAVVGATPAPRRVDEVAARTESAAGAAGWLTGIGPFGLRRSALVTAPLVFLAIIGAAFAVVPDESGADIEPPRAQAATTLASPLPAPAAGGGAAVIEQPAPKKPALAPGRLELAVAPWGEVVVDGKSRGLSPPLRIVELPAGSHTIEIRNSTFPAHVARVDVKSGEAVRIQHRFR